MIDIVSLIINADVTGLESVLIAHPRLANEHIPITKDNPSLAHPLHRISDAVFSQKITDDQAVRLASLFIKYGSEVNGHPIQAGKDSPLVAACSLHADKVALLLIDKGANIHHPGTHGGTALHWAAWCGRPIILKRLIDCGAAINQHCFEFRATPLFWAIHGLLHDVSAHSIDYTKCLEILLKNGADKNFTNKEGKSIIDLLRGSKFKHLIQFFSENEP
jgi:ankyrin repeat protein